MYNFFTAGVDKPRIKKAQLTSLSKLCTGRLLKFLLDSLFMRKIITGFSQVLFIFTHRFYGYLYLINNLFCTFSPTTNVTNNLNKDLVV